MVDLGGRELVFGAEYFKCWSVRRGLTCDLSSDAIFVFDAGLTPFTIYPALWLCIRYVLDCVFESRDARLSFIFHCLMLAHTWHDAMSVHFSYSKLYLIAGALRDPPLAPLHHRRHRWRQ